jgi:hypothetical protein
MEYEDRTYQILVTMVLEKGVDKKTVKEAIYSHLEYLIDEDSLFFSSLDQPNLPYFKE